MNKGTTAEHPGARCERTRYQRFDELIMAHAPALYRRARWLCSSQQETGEDLAQETLLRAWKGLDGLHASAGAKSWLFTILNREYARMLARPRIHTADVDVDALAADPFEWAADRSALSHALRALPPRYREPLLRHVLRGDAVEELARDMGVKPNTIKTRLFRARHKLRTHLNESARTRDPAGHAPAHQRRHALFRTSGQRP